MSLVLWFAIGYTLLLLLASFATYYPKRDRFRQDPLLFMAVFAVKPGIFIAAPWLLYFAMR